MTAGSMTLRTWKRGWTENARVENEKRSKIGGKAQKWKSPPAESSRVFHSFDFYPCSLLPCFAFFCFHSCVFSVTEIGPTELLSRTFSDVVVASWQLWVWINMKQTFIVAEIKIFANRRKRKKIVQRVKTVKTGISSVKNKNRIKSTKQLCLTP